MVVAGHVAQAEGLLSAWAKEEDDMMVVKLELGLQDNQGPGWSDARSRPLTLTPTQ